MKSVKITGHAVWFSTPQTIGDDVVETFAPGAFRESIEKGKVVLSDQEGGSGNIFASQISGTLTLTEDEIGLKVEAKVRPHIAARFHPPGFGIAFKPGEYEARAGEEGQRTEHRMLNADLLAIHLYKAEHTPIRLGPWTSLAVQQVLQERTRQVEKFGDQSHKPDDRWLGILQEELGEVAHELNEIDLSGQPPGLSERIRVRDEVLQVAAVALAWLEATEKRAWGEGLVPEVPQDGEEG